MPKRAVRPNRNGAMKILRARLFELEQRKKEAEFNAIVGEKKDIAWAVKSVLRFHTRWSKTIGPTHEVG